LTEFKQHKFCVATQKSPAPSVIPLTVEVWGFSKFRNKTNMNTPSVKSFRALRKLKLKVKTTDRVQITKAGGFVKARLRGSKNCVFGSTREEALARLRSTHESRKWLLVPVVITPLEQQLMDGLR
jgi:hypothetical protein